MPHCEGLGRLIASDLIGMGRSDKLPNSGPERYSKVGYESPSQFSREYSRMFGVPPRRDVDSLRRAAA
jgi:pimeloyl-ACP methyl ester carboxylesterase